MRWIFACVLCMLPWWEMSAADRAVYKESSNNHISADLVFPSGRTLTIAGTLSGTGAFDFSGGTLTIPSAFDLALSNLAQGSALSVLGVTGNATADNASIAAGSDHQVLRRSGTALAFGAVNLAQGNAVTGILGIANGGIGISFTDPNADRILFWDDSAGAFASLTLGTGLTITGTTIDVTAGAGDVTAASNFGADNRLIKSDGTTKGVQATGIAVDDSNNVSGIGTLGSTSAETEVFRILENVDQSHGLSIVADENLTADVSLLFDLDGANRSVRITGATVLSGTNTGDQTITLTGDVTGSGTGSFATTIEANSVALTTDTIGNYVADVAGTANEVAVSHTPAEGSTATVSLPATIDLGGKTSFEVPNGAAPTVDAFGEVAGDNNLWGTGRGAVVAYDGTASTALVGVLVSDTPGAGQVPKWQADGTILWEDDSTSAGGSIENEAFGSAWNGDITNGAAKDNIYDWGHIFDTDDDGKVNVLDLAAGIVKTDANGVTSIATAGTDYTSPSSTETLTNKTLTAPRFADLGFIADSAGNELLIFDETASAVNELTLSNAATGGNPKLSVTGGDTNISLEFGFKGNAEYIFNATSNRGANLRLYEDTDFGTNYVSLEVNVLGLSSNVFLSFPAATTTLVGRDSTDTLTNKTYDASGTGNSLRTKSYLRFPAAGQVDGTGCTVGTTSTAVDYGAAKFSNSADESGNYTQWRVSVPADLDTAAAMRARLHYRVGADTGTHRYVVSMANIADSGAGDAPTLSNAINIDETAAGTAGDIEASAWTTLTGWAAALTPDNTMLVRLARDGNATQDASIVDSSLVELVIECGSLQ